MQNSCQKWEVKAKFVLRFEFCAISGSKIQNWNEDGSVFKIEGKSFNSTCSYDNSGAQKIEKTVPFIYPLFLIRLDKNASVNMYN